MGMIFILILISIHVHRSIYIHTYTYYVTHIYILFIYIYIYNYIYAIHCAIDVPIDDLKAAVVLFVGGLYWQPNIHYIPAPRLLFGKDAALICQEMMTKLLGFMVISYHRHRLAK